MRHPRSWLLVLLVFLAGCSTLPAPIEDPGLFQGDILGIDPTRRVLGVRPTRLWSGGVMPYVVEAGGPANTVRAAIRRWERSTPLRFIERTDEVDYVEFARGVNCSSYVGRRGGRQVLNLGPGCGVDAATHELGHAWGVWHEHSRSDRGGFIRILLENVRPGFSHNFNVQGGNRIGDYDQRSLMHYGRYAFSDGSGPTIVSLDGGPLGSTGRLTALDIEGVLELYAEELEPPDPPDPPIEPDPHVLLLHGGKFRVTVAWETPVGLTGTGLAEPIEGNEKAGLLRFFADPQNVELLVKMLPYGDAIGGYWIGVAGTTDVGWQLTITEAATGRTWTTENPVGTVSAAAISAREFGR